MKYFAEYAIEDPINPSLGPFLEFWKNRFW